MQLSLHADYSCRTLMYLALLPEGEKASIETIASRYRISEHHLVKVVHKLGKLGFIETSRGRGGGIRLARQAHEIRMGDVIRQTEPNLTLVECFNSVTNTCSAINGCGLKPWLAKAMKAFLDVLDGVTLADVMAQRHQLMSVLGMAHELHGEALKLPQ